MSWQSIGTAPRDGTWFVACTAGEPESYEIGCFCPLIWHEYMEAGQGLYQKVPKVIHEWRGFNNFGRMTHWMPLLAPPDPTP